MFLSTDTTPSDVPLGRPSEVFFFPGESQGANRVDLSSPESMEGGLSLEAEQELSVAMEDSIDTNIPKHPDAGGEDEEEFCIIDNPGLGIAVGL